MALRTALLTLLVAAAGVCGGGGGGGGGHGGGRQWEVVIGGGHGGVTSRPEAAAVDSAEVITEGGYPTEAGRAAGGESRRPVEGGFGGGEYEATEGRRGGGGWLRRWPRDHGFSGGGNRPREAMVAEATRRSGHRAGGTEAVADGGWRSRWHGGGGGGGYGGGGFGAVDTEAAVTRGGGDLGGHEAAAVWRRRRRRRVWRPWRRTTWEATEVADSEAAEVLRGHGGGGGASAVEVAEEVATEATTSVDERAEITSVVADRDRDIQEVLYECRIGSRYNVE
ncbi:Protein of unknown function [Gryllus bimaculatus]|nr:Protein of unknown function [Gryllus bimaculatus]